MGFSALAQAAKDRLATFYNGRVYGPQNLGGMDGDGHTVNFVPALQDVATFGQGIVDAVEGVTADIEAVAADRDAAAASATAAAASAARLQGTSTTSRTPSVAAMNFTTQADKAFDAGSFVLAQSRGTVGRWASGKVSTYNAATGALTIAVEVIGPTVSAGSDWNLSVTGPRGTTGATGPFNAAAMYDFNLMYGS